MSDIFDILEICLQQIENGADLESVLASHPNHAAELRPILKASIVARTRAAAVSVPSSEIVHRGRAKVLQRAAQMREAKFTPRKREIPIFQRLAIAFTLAALFLASGTGLVSASSAALPGENLYPVKLTWENVRLFFTFDEEYRETLEHTFENERLHEVNELLVEGKDETIRFAGVYTEANGITYVAGVHVVVLDTSALPAQPLSNGVAVVVTGHTNAEGFVEVESIELLPAGSVVPTGEPAEVDTENDSDGDDVNMGVREENNDSGAKDDARKGDQSDEDTNGSRTNDDGNDSNDNNGDDNTSGDNINDNDGDDSNDDHSGSSDGGDDNTGGDSDDGDSGGSDDGDSGDDQ